MVVLIELLSHPVFKDFSLVTNKSGIYNQVKDTGIFEWENEDMINRTFQKGSLILTTLAVYKDDPEKAMDMMKLLIETKPSAICIKRIYYDSLPDEIIELANSKHVPIFFFSDTYFPDIIVTIRNALTPNEINTTQLKIINDILYGKHGPNEIELLAKSINPLFQGHIICAFGNMLNRDNSSEIIAKHELLYRNAITVKPFSIDEKMVWSRIYMPTGILFVCSDENSGTDMKHLIEKIMKMVNNDFDDFAIGISDIHCSLSEMDIAIKESIYASVGCQLMGTSKESFDSIGVIQMLCPLCGDHWVTNYYERMVRKLTEYDKTHNSNLMKTMLEFVRCNGNTIETANNLFQHVNTIRYRIKKIYSVLEIDNLRGKESQIYIIVMLHDIKKILGTIIETNV